MNFLNKSILVSFIILLSLISVACGELKIGVSAGDAGVSSSYTESLGATIDDQIHESTAISGSSLSQSFSGSGDRAETFSVTDNAGDHAEVGFDITNSNSYSGSYTLSPKTAKYAQATEKLDVNDADSIKAFANAYSRDGRAAEAIATITQGSLIGYTNSAYATSLKAIVTQKAKSASGTGSMWFGEQSGIFEGGNLVVYAGAQSISPPDTLPGNDQLTAYSGSASALKDSVKRDLTIGSLSSSYISSGPVAWNKDGNGNILTSSDAVISITGGQISGYTEKATATRNSAEVTQKVISASGSLIQTSSNAQNSEGDEAISNLQISNGQLSKYTITAIAKPTYVGSVLMAGSSKGDDIEAIGRSYNSVGDNSRVRITDSGLALINNLYLNPYADLKQVESYGGVGTISGLSIKGTGTAFNAGGESSKTSISVTNGYINGWCSDNQAKKGSATNPYMYFSKAEGTQVDIKSHAENRRAAYEGFSNDPVYYGGGDFEVQAKSMAKTRVQSSATSSNILITPKLPKTIKTAVILEPVQRYSEDVAMATDLGSTVFPDLVGKGYATLRYTDSAASKDKYSNLGFYDVVLAVGHMDSSNIYLSTAPGDADFIPANQLKYKTSKKTLVILNGCEGFGGYPQKSSLATAISRAYLGGGYAGKVDIAWSHDYMTYFFDELTSNEGMTASAANANALARVTAKYGSGQNHEPLRFYGKDDFKL